MLESINVLWRSASPLKRLLLAGVPAAVLALTAVGVSFAVFSGGSDSTQKEVLAATQPAATATTAPPTPNVGSSTPRRPRPGLIPSTQLVGTGGAGAGTGVRS